MKWNGMASCSTSIERREESLSLFVHTVDAVTKKSGHPHHT